MLNCDRQQLCALSQQVIASTVPEQFYRFLCAGVFLTHNALFAAGRPSSQVWSIGGDPVGCAQCDGNHVLVAAPGQAGKLSQRDPVLHSKWRSNQKM